MPVPQEWTAIPHGEAGSAMAGQAWLGDFADPRLEALVAEALSGNLGLQAGMARMEQAMAVARIEGADRLPSLSISGSAQRSQSYTIFQETPVQTLGNRYEIGAVASWEIDLWGRVRAQAAAANASAAAARADYEALRLSLATRIAQAWFNAIEARSQEALARETVASFESNLTTVEERFRRGLSPALDLRLTRANVATARANYSLQRRLADTAVRTLEVLLGRYPSAGLVPAEALPRLEDGVPSGLPSGLLDRRPDILAARQRVVAADAGLIEAQRSLLPAISLTARYGRASRELDDLLDDNFDVWSLLGNITAPVFQGGRLRANVDRSNSALAEAMANYQNAVLTSFREVESALVGETLLAEQLAAVELSAEESVGAQQLAEERYERGLVDIITVLESQRRAFNARSAALAVHNQLLQNRLALYLALGGPFE